MSVLKNNLFIAVLVGGAAYWVVMNTTLFPSTATTLNTAIEDATSWSNEAIQKNPVGYLQYQERNLAKNRQTVSDQINRVGLDKATISISLNKQKQNLGRVDELLSLAKSIYAKSEVNNSWPVRFAGKSYDKDEFVTQVEVMLNEKSLLSSTIEAMKKAEAELKFGQVKLFDARAKILMEQQNIANTNIIVRTKNITKNAMNTIEEISSAVRMIDSGMLEDQNSVRGTNVLIEAMEEMTKNSKLISNSNAAKIFLTDSKAVEK